MGLIDADELKEIIKRKNVIVDPEMIRQVSIDELFDYVFKKQKQFLLNAINNAPSVDAVPVVHASWRGYNAENKDFLMDNGEPIFIVCSECACTVINNGSYVWNYCPKCGAKMDGKKVE